MTQWFRFVIPLNEDGSRVTYSPNWAGTMPKCPQDVTVLLYNDKEGYGIAQTADKFVPKEVTVLSDKYAKKILDSAKDEDGVYFGQKLADRWNPEVLIEDKPVEEVPVSDLTRAFVRYDDGVIWDMMPITLAEFLGKYPDAKCVEDTEANKKIWTQVLSSIGGIEGTVVSGETTHEAVAEMPLVIQPVEIIPEGVPTTRKAVFCPICHQFIMWLPGNIIAKTIQLTCKNSHKVVLHGR